MAIYHLSAKVIGRSSGRSATGAAAYRAAEIMRDERTGIVHDYSRKSGVEHREIVAPDNAPAWMQDREQLWNAVEKVERRKDAQLAREVEVGIPRELTPDQRRELVREFVREEFVGRGMIADVCWHMGKASDGGAHPHAHIMLTMRELTVDGFGAKNRDWNAKDVLEGWRERWETHANRALERAGRDERIDHRSFADRGIDREPQPKMGPFATRLERRGVPTERGDELRAVEVRNSERAELETRRNGLDRQIDVIREALVALRERTEEAASRASSAVRDVWETVTDKMVQWFGMEKSSASEAEAGRDHADDGIRGGSDESISGKAANKVRTKSEIDRLLGRRTKEGETKKPVDANRLLGRVVRPPDPQRTKPDVDRLLGRSRADKESHLSDVGREGEPTSPTSNGKNDRGRDGGDRDR